MAGSKMHLYPRIKCPFCTWQTSAAEKLGIHIVDKHATKVVKGYLKVKTKQGTKKGK